MMSKFYARILAFALVAAILPACGNNGNDGGGAPSATQFKATLRGGQEVPVVVSDGTGTAQVSVNSGHTEMTVTLTVANLTGITLAHIHAGPVGQDGPIIFNLATSSFTSPLTVTLAEADLHPAPAQGINTFGDAVNALMAGKTYANVHTTTNPDGEIRGQLGPVDFSAAMDGASEVPPVATAGTGTVTLHLDESQSSLHFTLTVSNLTSTPTMAHIHVGAPGVSGPIILNYATSPYGGSISGTLTAADLLPAPAQGINTFEDAVNALITGRTYSNVHTTLNPGGEIRGQNKVVP